MSDRELLELAARAAFIKVDGWYSDENEFWADIGGPDKVTEWNPLTDDGDALRLSTKLHMDIYHYHLDQDPHIAVHAPRNEYGVIEDYASHPNIESATRRAIVRAAAEIGKTMTDAPSATQPAGEA